MPSALGRHFGAVGVLHETWQVPGATHFYPAGSVVVGEGAKRATLEEALADFLYRKLGPAGL